MFELFFSYNVMFTYRTLQAPVTVQLELTERCNNHCRHCYNFWREQACQRVSLTKTQLDRILDQFTAAQVMSVTITGGEPLLCRKTLLYALSGLQSAGIDTHLNSNLTLLDAAYARELKKRGVRSILTSLLSCHRDTHNTLTGNPASFDATIQGIRYAQNAGLRVGIGMVLTQHNRAHLFDTALFVRELGVNTFAAVKVMPSAQQETFQALRLTQEQVLNSLDVLHRIKTECEMDVDILECYPLCLFQDVTRFQHFARRSCSAGKTNCTIGAHGEVRPCSHSDMSYGNMLEEELTEIWQRMTDWRDNRYLPEVCQDCQWLPQCSGGCRMEARTSCGDICGADPYMNSPRHVRNLPQQKPVERIPADQPVSLTDTLKYRSESFGGMLYSTATGSVFVNHETFNLLQRLKTEEVFTINHVKRIVDDPLDQLTPFLSHLKTKGMLIPQKRR